MEKPILFNTDMVRAILDGRKTVTRRLIKQPWGNSCTHCRYVHNEFIYDNMAETVYCARCGEPLWINPFTDKGYKAPYQIEDFLYVRETFTESCPYGIDDCPTGKPKQADRLCDVCQHNKPFYYKADGIDAGYVKWTPSIHMPKQAARIWLKVTNVKVERLQDITNEQILAEGANKDRIDSYIRKMAEDTEEWTRAAYLLEWSNLWDDTVKADRQKWENNPWVWVIEFERCEKPEQDGAE